MPVAISMVAVPPFAHQVKWDKLKIFSLSPHEINRALARENVVNGNFNLKEILLAEYHDFLPLFDEVIVRGLPPHRPYDHSMPLKEAFTPPFGQVYSLNRVELETLWTWIEDNSSKGFIHSSSPPLAPPPCSSRRPMVAFASVSTFMA